jgi:hypothetical protein
MLIDFRSLPTKLKVNAGFGISEAETITFVLSKSDLKNSKSVIAESWCSVV